MMMTLLGAAASDTLDTGQVVSGVGGQYNFVAMAHALPGGRSILKLRSTRSSKGRVESNFRFSYGNLTIPRHLRDIVVTEYGIADLRGQCDADVIKALLNIADSRFQPALMAEAKRNGKLEKSYQINDLFRNNTPESVRETLAQGKSSGLFPAFPYGTDLNDDELVLAKALKWLQRESATSPGKGRLALSMLSSSASANARPYLERMKLDRPAGVRERLYARLVTAGLKKTGAI